MRVNRPATSLSAAGATRFVFASFIVLASVPIRGLASSQERSARPPSHSLPAKEENADRLTVRGKVLRPDGRPAAGAEVFVLRNYYLRQNRRRPVAMTRTGSDGSFEVCYLKSQIGHGLGSNWKWTAVVAELPGFGLDWLTWRDIEPAVPLVLKLVRDFPIKGCVVDRNGKPVAGVRVRINFIESNAAGNLDSTLAAMKAVPEASSVIGGTSKVLSSRYAAFDPASTTDTDGRFSLTGVGAERLVALEFQGDSIAYSQAQVATRAAIPHIPGVSAGIDPLYPAQFTLTATPMRPIVGTVRDAASGKRLRGVHVQSYRFPGSHYLCDVLGADTDANGHYQLLGMPEGKGASILVLPNGDEPYLMRMIEIVPERTGLRPLTLDIELHHGLWIRGKVTDEATGKPIVGAYAQYLPLLTNPFTIRLPEFDRSQGRRRMEGDQSLRYTTDTEGRFRIPGLPGRGVVGVRAPTQNYVNGVGASEIHEHDESGMFQTYVGPAYFFANSHSAFKEVNPSADAREIECNFALVPGKSIRLHLVDPDGRPIHGCSANGVQPGGGAEFGMDSTSEIVGLAPDETRRLWIHHLARKLGKCLELKPGDRPQAMTVKLEPCAILSGRLVDFGGAPLQGLVVSARPLGFPGLSAYATSQVDGRFAYPYLTVGCDYTLHVAQARRLIMRGRGSDDPIKVRSSKTIDLGEIKIEQRTMRRGRIK